jgi:hypothetical protein
MPGMARYLDTSRKIVSVRRPCIKNRELALGDLAALYFCFESCSRTTQNSTCIRSRKSRHRRTDVSYDVLHVFSLTKGHQRRTIRYFIVWEHSHRAVLGRPWNTWYRFHEQSNKLNDMCEYTDGNSNWQIDQKTWINSQMSRPKVGCSLDTTSFHSRLRSSEVGPAACELSPRRSAICGRYVVRWEGAAQGRVGCRCAGRTVGWCP